MKLSCFKILFQLKNDELNNLVFLNKQENFDYADIGILFGGISMIPYRADVAISLYQSGKIKKILITGKSSFLQLNQKTEAEILQEYLIQHGVPKNCILLETKSKTTSQNVSYSYLLLQKLDLDKNVSIALITSDFHLKRCYRLFSSYRFSKLFLVGACDGITDKNHWYQTRKGRFIIKREALLLYLNKLL